MDRDDILNTNTPRGNHWIGASSTSSIYVPNGNFSSTGRQRRFQSSTLNKAGPAARAAPDDSFSNNNKSTVDSEKNYAIKMNTLPLISPEVVEVSRQRTLAVLIFFIIQGYKLYDLILLKTGLPVSGFLFNSSRLNFISKYFIIDSMFLYFLPSFKIPMLTFKPWLVALQIILVAVITTLLSNEHDFILLSVAVSFWRKLNTKEMSVTGSSVNLRKVMDSSSHFKGALTIKILPENTAMLNPLHQSYCLPMDSNLLPEGHIKIPTRINSTADISLVQLEFRDLYTNKSELRNLTDKDFKSVIDLSQLLPKGSQIPPDLHDSSTIRYLELPLNEVGFYQIKKIVDSNNLSLKIYNSHLIVSHCPVATISGEGEANRCIGDSDKIFIDIQGVPPMKLSYSKVINGETHSFVDSNLVPEFFESPLQSTPKHYFSANDLNDLKWCRTYPVNISLDLPISHDGHYVYTIDKLVDGLGNVMDFTKIPRSLQKDSDLSYDFKVHGIPRASLEENFDSKSPTKRSIVLKFENMEDWDSSVPYVANISYTSDNEKIKIMQFSINSPSKAFEAEFPGNYKLEAVTSNYCPGVVIGRSSILVTKPVPPQLDVKSAPILDQCVGQVGLNFDLTFTGVPPFYYKVMIYKVENGKRKLYDTKRYSSQGTRNQFSYNPASEGNYDILFDHLTNQLFTEPISLIPQEKYTFKTSMRVKPGASLQKTHEIKLCLGDQTEIPVSFHGEPPFTLNYDIVETSSNKRMSYIVEDITSYEHDIKIPNFNVGGDYILSLVSIKDSSECLVGLSEPDAIIKIRRDIPSASFNLRENSKDVKIKQGSFAHIPIKLAGESPFVLKYQHLDYDGQVLGVYETKFHSSHKPTLKASKEGLYRLTEVRDSSCQGNIDNPDFQFKVSFLDKPSFSVLDTYKITKLTETTFAKQAVCQGREGTIDLALSGSAPFILKYDVITPTGHTSSKNIQVTTKYATIRLPNEEPGEYVVIIGALYDSNYAEDDFSKAGYIASEVIIKQTVNPIPAVSFADSGKTLRACSTAVNEGAIALEPIELKFTQGQAPFSVTFSVYHESTSRSDHFTVNEVAPGSFAYQKLYEGLKLGNHVVTIEKVIDASGCVNDLVATQDNHILISITEAPKIHLLDPSAEYCVGDYVAYQLSGIPPFTVRYEFNGIQLKLKEYSSQFVRLASEPGTISIVSLGDSTSQCIVNFTQSSLKKEYEKLSLLIHPIPSVEVSKGRNLIEDIHEGDQAEIIFTFEGNPPFSLTYVRTEEAEGNHNKGRPQVVETHKVSDIYAYEYRVVTSLQGTYEAIEVSDAFCFAKNDAYFNN